jgi:hypothetical protein
MRAGQSADAIQTKRVQAISGIIVKQPRCIVVAWLLIFTLLTGTEMANAGPFQDFFGALRSPIAHQEHKPRPYRSSDIHNEAPPSDAPNRHALDTSVSAPPDGGNVRLAKVASGTKQEKGNLPYGTPVPGKAGLVTSPFAPDSGYVDVRSFPPGTEIKDPYTGKTFLTP